MTLQMNTVVAHRIPGKPPVVMDKAHYSRLHDLASAALRRDPDVAALLLNELERAELCISEEMPATVVNIGSQVTFRYNDNGHSRTVRLVYPKDANIGEGSISVLTPIGATLLGLAETDQMKWTTRHGEMRSLTILKVEHPEHE